jgi:hypothetical protein
MAAIPTLPTAALRGGLNQGISSGNLVDTKIILYSHRDSSGRVCRPKALYANSHALKTVPYFNDREPSATIDDIRAEPHLSKSSSGTSQSPNQRTSVRTQSTMKNLRRTTDTSLTATLRTTRMIRLPRPNAQSSRRSIRATRLEFQVRVGRSSVARSMRNTLKRGRLSKSRTWRS